VQRLGAQIVVSFGEYYGVPNPDDPTEELAPDHTLSAIDESQIPNLVTAVSSFAKDLTIANDDFQTHDTPADNVQNRVLLSASLISATLRIKALSDTPLTTSRILAISRAGSWMILSFLASTRETLARSQVRLTNRLSQKFRGNAVSRQLA
jgi:hypothetical protein